MTRTDFLEGARNASYVIVSAHSAIELDRGNIIAIDVSSTPVFHNVVSSLHPSRR